MNRNQSSFPSKIAKTFIAFSRFSLPLPSYLVAAITGLLAVMSFAQAADRNMEKERAIWQQLEAIAPGAVETFKAATVALDKDDYQEAARLYELVMQQAPQFDPVIRRLGMSLMHLGQMKDGLALLETAVHMKRSPENLISLAQALAYPGKNNQSTQENKERALALAQEADAANTADDFSYPALVGQLSLDLERFQDFRDATKVLVRKYPNVMATHYFNAIRAALDEDWITAEKEIKKAGSMGLPAEVVNKFLESGIHSRATVWRYVYYSLYLVAAWIAGLILLFLLGKLLSNITLHSIATDDPNASASARQISLRRYYKTLINFAGFYYYISQPVVIGLVIAVAASIIYAIFMLGYIPYKLVLLIAIGALVTVYQMVRSVLTRHKQEDPGRSLRPDEAPGLSTLAREVAQAVNTRPIDEIRVLPGTDLAVYERGSFMERRQDRAHRILILGIGALNGFRQNAFRAVLAHEYGHFTHRDTAGGDVAIRVNADMMRFAAAMYASGQAVHWNIAFQFLRVYHLIFRRLSHGATRLQEVLADRVAVRNYGAKAFEDGLRHVIRRKVEFDYLASQEIQEATNARRALQNLYELVPTQATEDEKKIEDEIDKEIHRPSSEDDTHPGPAERFALASRIASASQLPPDGMVWELFTDKEHLTSEMNSLIDKQVKAATA